MKRKRLSVVLALLLSISVLVSCGNGDNPSESDQTPGNSSMLETDDGGESSGIDNEDIVYPMKDAVTLSLGSGEHGHVAAVNQLTDTPFWSEWQKLTGVVLEYVLINDFSVMLASGNYPDMIRTGEFRSYTGGVDQAIEDDMIIPIDDYLDTYARDYYARLESNEFWMKGAKTPNGHFPGFYHLRTDEPGISNNFGLIFRQDWLNTLDLEAPETVDEFVEMLRAFRDEMGAEAPFSLPVGDLRNVGSHGLLTSAFNLVNTGYFHKDGTVYHGSYEAEYKDYLQWLNELYEEGLLDKNFLTIDGAVKNSNMMTGIAGASAAYAGGGIGVWMTTATQENPDYLLVGVSSLVGNPGERALYNQQDPAVPGTMAVVTSACEDIEAAVQFLNYGYTEEGDKLFQFGIEGQSFEMRDNSPYYTDLVLDNPDGLPFTQAIGQYAFTPEHGPYIQGGQFCIQSYTDIQNEALANWNDSDSLDYYIPPLTVSADDAEEYTTIMSEVNTFISENFALFVTGEKSLDEFDRYLSTLEGMRIERAIELYQNAFDLFNE